MEGPISVRWNPSANSLGQPDGHYISTVRRRDVVRHEYYSVESQKRQTLLSENGMQTGLVVLTGGKQSRKWNYKFLLLKPNGAPIGEVRQEFGLHGFQWNLHDGYCNVYVYKIIDDEDLLESSVIPKQRIGIWVDSYAPTYLNFLQ